MYVVGAVVGAILILCPPALLFADLAGVIQIPPDQKGDYYIGVALMALFGFFILAASIAGKTPKSEEEKTPRDEND